MLLRRLLQISIAVFGRRNAYRLGRYLASEARLDSANDPTSNGERDLQRFVLDNFSRPVVFDVGANVGAWTESLLGFGPAEVHAFEPCAGTFALLRDRMTARATLVQAALSCAPGVASLHVKGDGLGINTLTEPLDGEKYPKSELVRVTTVAEYCRQFGIGHIDLLKIDAEGHDFEVIAGAAGMLRSIAFIQFEYNQRWIMQRRFLRDVFQLLQPNGFTIGKLTPRGVEFYSSWSWELETFREGNYIACGSRFAEKMKCISPAWLRI